MGQQKPSQPMGTDPGCRIWALQAVQGGMGMGMGMGMGIWVGMGIWMGMEILQLP